VFERLISIGFCFDERGLGGKEWVSGLLLLTASMLSIDDTLHGRMKVVSTYRDDRVLHHATASQAVA
jgi:hypothetical protein